MLKTIYLDMDGVSILLTRGKVALVSPEDAVAVRRHSWCASPAPDRTDLWYAQARINGVLVSLHRFLMRPPTGMVVDHDNGDGLDCRRGNMAVVTQTENRLNPRHLRRDNTSGNHGVWWCKSKQRWCAEMRAFGARRARYFRTQDQAAAHRRIEGFPC